jgi:hypothetical protein
MKYCNVYNPIQALGFPLNLLCSGEPISCQPSILSPPRFPNGPKTQLRIAARTKNSNPGGPSGGTTGSAKGSPRHPCPNTYRAARVLGSPTCSRSQTHELESMLPLLAQQMSNMAATFGPNSKPRENKLRTSPSDCKTTSPQIPVNPRSESSLNRTTTPKLHRHPPQVDSP